MPRLHILRRLLLCAMCILTLANCTKNEPFNEKMFIGKWHSSKLVTPVYLYENGEWEIKKDEHAVLQFGTWQYNKGRIIWSFKAGGVIAHDPNVVVSVTDKSFQIKEADGSLTTYTRLE